MPDYTAGIITVSDKGSRGERADTSSAEIRKVLENVSVSVVCYDIVPDERGMIAEKIIQYADDRKLDLILTTGGTGVSPRDVTPEATLDVIDREIPGIGEYMRAKSAEITPHAIISRAVAGVRKSSLIINLPGSPRGARENLSFVLPALKHAVEKIKGDPSECAS
ncbi:MAG TPA: MogA/MoaB family molybdenum cofactor biosynthesis protein [Syntrophales bacterium]|nr:MogA/MoaB family molybdenum cofactor biosynthesis protein [Syntrophales bacterium]HRR39611.1 MogA/MoaB family molybdenum cofactor biosynthesis protein [Syntrophales bacterium]HRT70783.1 MogA/MoaB family molybdenum cofactor biosynthesis protein [Syntrophales bacterium]